MSVPLLDVSLHSSKTNEMISVVNEGSIYRGNNLFEISSSFYNSSVGKWEPCIEKWSFVLDFEFKLGKEDYLNRIDITNNTNDILNINASDEMVT